MSIASAVVEVERPVSEVKMSMLLTLDGTATVQEDIGS